MPIRINLLAEAQTAAEMRRKDPVKRSVWLGGFLVFLVVLWAAKLQLDVMSQKNAVARLDGDWKALQTKYAAVTNAQFHTADVEKKLAALDNLSTNRTLWGPILNTLQESMPADDSVQVTHIRGDQTFAHDTPKKKNGSMVEKDSLFIEAKDLKPGEQSYTKYKEALGSASYFERRFGRKDGFVMEGVLGALTVDPVDPSKQFVTFTLVSHLPETRRDD